MTPRRRNAWIPASHTCFSQPVRREHLGLAELRRTRPDGAGAHERADDCADMYRLMSFWVVPACLTLIFPRESAVPRQNQISEGLLTFARPTLIDCARTSAGNVLSVLAAFGSKCPTALMSFMSSRMPTHPLTGTGRASLPPPLIHARRVGPWARMARFLPGSSRLAIGRDLIDGSPASAAPTTTEE